MFQSPYDKQLDAIFFWLSSVAREDDRVLVHIPGKRGTYRFKFPLKVGDYPLRIIPKEREPATFAVLGDEKLLEQKESWVSVFSSPEFSVYEHRTRSSAPLLRWGVNTAERRMLLALARESLGAHLFYRGFVLPELSSELREKFQEHLDVDVALWVRGKLRGSRIVINKPIFEGIIDAVKSAARDLRFKPISKDELSELRIEITIFSPLQIPITKKILTENRIFPEKGYRLTFGGRTGWLLPEVFNVLQFGNLFEFLEMLARKKAGLLSVDKKVLAHTVIFDVEDFVEPEEAGVEPTILYATMPRIVSSSLIINQQKAHTAAMWLSCIQEVDGNIPPVIDFSTTENSGLVDWSRLCFAGIALEEFGKSSHEKQFCEAAERVLGYFERTFLLDLSGKSLASHPQALAYAGQLALKLGRTKFAGRIGEVLALHNIPKSAFNPILYAQCAKFLSELPEVEYRLIKENLLDSLRKRFRSEKKDAPEFDFASWASAVEAFWDIDRAFALEIAGWIAKYQYPDGSFPTSPRNPRSYTRGTGKIAEVFALDPARNVETEKALSWLGSMQYTVDTMFFVPPGAQGRVFGSLRHDYLHWESWTDSVAHYVIAVAHFHQQEKSALSTPR